jgi:RNA polymerase sigma factor (sigma-70 family)
MSSAQIGIVLRHLHRLAGVRQDLDSSDEELLERFATRRDEAAFAALLRRHGAMVLGVCQSVLHNLHDAEDAFQAVFLVLARKTGSIHRREAVSSWLHRVAYHIAVDAQADAARRRILEKRAVTMPPPDPVLDMSLRELRRVLNEELQQLPEAYRAPLVLCCVEEKSLDEAARLLDWTKWTVKGRLQRGREQLRQRLRRRGLEVSAGLLVTLLSTRALAAQVPATLAAATVQAAQCLAAGKEPGPGLISAKVAALVQGATQTMFTSKLKIATALFLAVSVATTASGLLLHRVSAGEKPVPELRLPAQAPERDETRAASHPTPVAEETLAVSGRVLDADGNPLAGARLYLASHMGKRFHVAERATSGNDGRFTLRIARSEMRRAAAGAAQERLQILANADGFGPDWIMLDGAGPLDGLTLRLVKDVPISGRILDPDGKPVAGARITVTGVMAARGEDLGGYLETVHTGHGWRYAFAKHWGGPLPGQTAVLTTGADGRLKLAGIGRERIVNFHLEGPAIATADFQVMTRAAEKVGHVQGASFDHLAAASRPIRGIVRDKATGKPLAGVAIGVMASRNLGVYPTRTVTDKDGRYEVLGIAKSPQYFVQLRPPDGSYFRRSAEVKDTVGLDPLIADIDMVQGLTVRGKIMDKATGRPIATARVDYHPLWQNPYVARKLTGGWDPHSETTTGPDGSYTLTVLAGPGLLGVAAPNAEAYTPGCLTVQERRAFFKLPLAAMNYQSERFLVPAMGEATGGPPLLPTDYNAAIPLEIGEKDEMLVRDVALERPRELKGRVVGPDGRPLTGVSISGLGPGGRVDGAEFIIRGINPRATRELLFLHKEKNLGYYLKELRGDRTEPLAIKLQPCGSASGRLVDGDGVPVPGWRMILMARGLEATTDKDGRFRLEGLVPGQQNDIRTSTLSFPVFVVVKPSEHKDLGDVNKAKLEPGR